MNHEHHHHTDTTAVTKTHTDPVCGMKVAANPEKSAEYEGKTYYFCSQGCVTKFKKEPTKFIKASAKGDFDPCDHGEENHSSDAKMEHASDADKVRAV